MHIWSDNDRKIVSEYDQEIPQSQTADNPMAARKAVNWDVKHHHKQTSGQTIGYTSLKSFEARPPLR